MTFYEHYTLDQLNRALTASKWLLVIFGVVLACAGILNQWLSDRIATLQREEKIKAQERLNASEEELKRTKAKTVEVASQLARFSTPRRLTNEQVESLRASLPSGPRGKVVVTFLSVETDAEKFSDQIASLLTECGFEVIRPRKLWLQMALDGIYLVARDTSNAPAHAVHMQNCFKAAGVELPAMQDPRVFSEFAEPIPDDAVILAVSNRK
jgi:hypothetical protein